MTTEPPLPFGKILKNSTELVLACGEYQACSPRDAGGTADNDTPTAIRVLMHNPEMISCMSDYGLLARRPNGAPTALIQGLVAEASRDAVRAASRNSGVKISYYLDTLILSIVKEAGALPLVDPPRPDRTDQIDAIAELLGGAEGSSSSGSVGLQGRVSPEARDAVSAAIDASGVPKTYYLEGLIKKLIAENGTMPLIDPPRRVRGNHPEVLRDFPEVANRTAA